MDEITIPRLLTVSACAELLGCSTAHVQRSLRRGELAAIQLGSLLRIPASEIERLLNEGAARRDERAEVAARHYVVVRAPEARPSVVHRLRSVA